MTIPLSHHDLAETSGPATLVGFLDRVEQERAQLRRERAEIEARRAEHASRSGVSTARRSAGMAIVLCVVCFVIAVGLMLAGLPFWQAFLFYVIAPAAVISLRVLYVLILDLTTAPEHAPLSAEGQTR